MATFVPEDWEVVNDDGFIYRRQKSSIAADASGSGLQREESIITPDMLNVASESAQLRKNKMLLAKKARLISELQQWEAFINESFEIALPPRVAAKASDTSGNAVDILPEIYQKLVTQVEQAEKCNQIGHRLLSELQAELKNSFVLSTPFASARKDILKDLGSLSDAKLV